MRKMQFASMLVFMAGLLSGCPDVIKPEQTDALAGTGRVIVSVVGTGERTILPGAPEFSKFEFTFEPLDGQPGRGKVTVIAGGGATEPVELVEGKWNIIAKGFVNISGIEGIANGEYRAAEGRQDNVTVNAGKTASVSIDLKGAVQAGEKGVFTWDMSLLEGAESATMAIRTIEGANVKEINLKANPRGDTALDSGYYLVTLILDSQPAKTEILHIYGGMTSSADLNVLFFNNLDAMANYIGKAPANNADTPYEIILYGLNVETDFVQGDDQLGRLFNSLKGKYVKLDMSACKGQNIRVKSFDVAYNRPDRDKLVGIKLPNSITGIGDYAFLHCSGLTGSLTIPNSVTSIGAMAFRECRGLTGPLTIPDSVTNIGDYAFLYCSFTSVTIGNSVADIGQRAFDNASNNLSAINVDANNRNYSSEQGILYNYNKTTLIQYPRKKQVPHFSYRSALPASGSGLFTIVLTLPA